MLEHLSLLGGHVGARNRAVANIVNSSLAGPSQTELGVNALNPVGRVDVLDKGNLEAGSSTLAGSDSRVSQEIFPDLQALACLPSRVATHSP